MKAYYRGRIQCTTEASTTTSKGKTGRGDSAMNGDCNLLQAQQNGKAVCSIQKR